jgi:hypothetical protein
MRFKTFMESDIYKGRWGTIRDIRPSTKAKWKHIASGDSGDMMFLYPLPDAIGKKFMFFKAKEYTDLYYVKNINAYQYMTYVHPDWINFDDEKNGQINLFKND